MEAMGHVSKEVKERYWKKKAEDAPMIQCACGCGEELKAIDNYGRRRRYLTGHNRRRYQHTSNPHYEADKRWRKRNPEKVATAKVARYRRKKVMLICHKGGECERCGLKYNGKNGTNFDFHHPDPFTKEGSISDMIGNKSLQKLMEEVDKCMLVCSHCHALIHYGEW